MSISADKRGRSQNWSQDEIEFLIECVGSKVGIIENKRTDSMSSKKKNSIWLEFEKKFAENDLCGNRTEAQISAKWKGLKAVGFWLLFPLFQMVLSRFLVWDDAMWGWEFEGFF